MAEARLDSLRLGPHCLVCVCHKLASSVFIRFIFAYCAIALYVCQEGKQRENSTQYLVVRI